MSQEKETVIPNCLKNKVSLKKATLQSLDTLIKYLNKNNGDYQVLLMTPSGFIKGDIDEYATEETFLTQTDEPGNLHVDISVIMETRSHFIKEIETKNPAIELVDYSAGLNLKNVTVYKNDLIDPILTIDQMIVFTDQIISFSLISRKHNQL